MNCLSYQILHDISLPNLKMLWIMNDPFLCQLLYQFLKSEFAHEGLLFLRYVNLFKKKWKGVDLSDLGQVELIKKDTRAIFYTFIAQNSPHQINISAQLANSIEQSFLGGLINHLIFDKGYSEIMRMLVRDKLSRFLSEISSPNGFIDEDVGRFLAEGLDEMQMMEKECAIIHDIQVLFHDFMVQPPQRCILPRPRGLVGKMASVRLLMSQLGLIPPRNSSDYQILASGMHPSDENKVGKEGDDDISVPQYDTQQNWKNVLRQIKNLDTISAREQVKVAVLYVGKGQIDQRSILENQRGSEKYERFVDSLGWSVTLDQHEGFAGKLDTLRLSNGRKFPYFCDEFVEIFFHVSTRMPLQVSFRG